MQLKAADPDPRSVRGLTGDLTSNFVYVVVMALVTIFVVPIYVRILGPSVWGNISLCLTLQGLLFLLDMTLAPIMLREVARLRTTDDAHALYEKFLRFYFVCALLAVVAGEIALLSFSAAASASSLDLRLALHLALLQFLFQFSNNAATGYWYGTLQQRRANLRLACFALSKHAGALLLVTYWQPSAVAYLLSFAGISSIEFASNYLSVRRDASSAWRSIVTDDLPWRDMSGYAAASLLALAAAQMDRYWLAFSLPAATYGVYFLCSSLMASMFSLQLPLQRAFLPRMAVAALPREVARTMLRFEFVLIVVPGLLFATFPELVLRLWLHDPAIAASAALPFRLLMLATALNALYAPSGLLLLNAHRNSVMIVLNSIILVVQIPLLMVLTPKFGASAGGCAWIACALLQCSCALWLRFASPGSERTGSSDNPPAPRKT